MNGNPLLVRKFLVGKPHKRVFTEAIFLYSGFREDLLLLWLEKGKSLQCNVPAHREPNLHLRASRYRQEGQYGPAENTAPDAGASRHPGSVSKIQDSGLAPGYY